MTHPRGGRHAGAVAPGRRPGPEWGSFIVDHTGTILGFDDGMEALTGWPAAEVVGRSKDLPGPLAGTAPAGRLRTLPLYEGRIFAPSRPSRLELRMHDRQGRCMDVEATAHNLAGGGDRVVITVTRILSRSPSVPTTAVAHLRDPLTGLLNRDAFGRRIHQEFGALWGGSRPVALILVDVDHLRDINDALGRDAGDAVLRKLAAILAAAVHDDDLVGRLEEDDFALFLPGIGRGEARRISAGIRSTVERYRFFDGEDHERRRVTLSLGAASAPADADNPDDLLARAREALDEARALGRNRVWCYLRRPRVPVQVPVYFDSVDSLLVGYTRDLSPSGAFVQTAVSMDIGMRCALAFPLPGSDMRVHVVGRVVRAVPPETGSAPGTVRIPGMGVEFERFGGPRDRRAVDVFVHRNEARTLRPEGRILTA